MPLFFMKPSTSIVTEFPREKGGGRPYGPPPPFFTADGRSVRYEP